MLTLIDFFGGTLLIFSLAMFEMIAVFWIYGIENFCLDIEYMTGRKSSLYWRICWTIVTPLFMIFIFIYSMAAFVPLKYSGWSYPDGLMALGWAIYGLGFALFPVLFVAALMRYRRTTMWQTLCAACTPTESWGPEDQEHRERWREFKAVAIEKRKRQAKEAGHSRLRQTVWIVLGWYRTD